MSMILRSKVLKDPNAFKKEDDGEKDCNKDVEGLVTLNQFSRGHVFFVHSSAIIRQWNPIYNSEGCAQVSIMVIKFCALTIKLFGVALLTSMYLFYDNMCKLERLNLWKAD